RQGHHGPAAEYYAQVLDLARGPGELNYQFEAHIGLGRAHQDAGDPKQALDAHLLALDLARALGQLPDVIRALDGAAQAHLTLGHPAQARELWQQARSILSDLDMPATEDVTAEDIEISLADLDKPPKQPRRSPNSA